jgi:hypothetical protein
MWGHTINPMSNRHEGAFYSPDGVTIQFDNGTVWQRVFDMPPPRMR